MKRRTKLFLGVGILALCTMGSISALDLSQIVDASKKNSPLMQTYILQKENSSLSITQGDLGKKLQVTAEGNVTWTGPGSDTTIPAGKPYDYIVSATPSIAVVLPNDGDTTISFGFGKSGASVSREKSASDNVYSVTPTLGAQHTFTFGKTDDARSNLMTTQSTLLRDSSFISNELAFESDVYKKLTAILEAQKNLLGVQRQIESQQKAMEDSLRLGTTSKDSVAYRGQEVALLNLKNSLVSVQSQLELAKAQYKVATGLVYDTVENIPQPILAFSPLTMGNTPVLLKKVAWEIAREDFELKQAETQNTSLVVSGSGAVALSKAGSSATEVKSGTVMAGGKLSQAKNFSVSASASFSGLGTPQITPSVTVGGSWQNGASSESDRLTLQQLENKMLIAQLEYNEALTNYTINAGNLQNSIATWQNQYDQLALKQDYNKKSVAHAKELLSVGLGTQDAVVDAELLVQQDEYDQAITLLNGLILENQIKTMLI